MGQRSGGLRSAPLPAAHRLRPVVVATCCVVAAYVGLQSVAGSTMTSTLWWQGEWVRLRLHHQFPRASFTQPVPGPSWEGWLPAGVTACVITLALLLLALAVVSAGRGWWLLLVAALPLIPTQIAPGTWAPELSNQVMYAVVWPAGATAPSTAWAWVSAGIEALVVAVPAMALRSVVVERRPVVFTVEVLGRLAPAGIAAAAVVTWNYYAGEPQEWDTIARRAAFVVLGAMLVSGSIRRRRWALPLFAVLPAVAAGAVRWTTGVDGHPVVVYDTAAWALSVAMICGAVWVFVQPLLATALRWLRRHWVAMVAADIARRSAASQPPAEDEPAELPLPAELPEQTVSRPARRAAVAPGGRHRM